MLLPGSNTRSLKARFPRPESAWSLRLDTQALTEGEDYDAVRINPPEPDSAARPRRLPAPRCFQASSHGAVLAPRPLRRRNQRRRVRLSLHRSAGKIERLISSMRPARRKRRSSRRRRSTTNRSIQARGSGCRAPVPRSSRVAGEDVGNAVLAQPREVPSETVSVNTTTIGSPPISARPTRSCRVRRARCRRRPRRAGRTRGPWIADWIGIAVRLRVFLAGDAARPARRRRRADRATARKAVRAVVFSGPPPTHRETAIDARDHVADHIGLHAAPRASRSASATLRLT